MAICSPWFDMKQIITVLFLLAAWAGPASAASCAEGFPIIEEMSKTLDLSVAERANVHALVAKAKIEERQGHQKNCKITLSGAIRFFLIKTVLD